MTVIEQEWYDAVAEIVDKQVELDLAPNCTFGSVGVEDTCEVAFEAVKVYLETHPLNPAFWIKFYSK